MDTASLDAVVLTPYSRARLLAFLHSSADPARKSDRLSRSLVVAMIAFTVTACSGGTGPQVAASNTAAAEATHSVNGMVSVWTGGGGCAFVTPTVGAGTPVVVSNENMEELATTRLGKGVVGKLDDKECNFPFRATLPSTSSYLFSVGDQLNLEVATKDLKRHGWSVTINSPNIL